MKSLPSPSYNHKSRTLKDQSLQAEEQEEDQDEEEEGKVERARCEWDLSLSTIISSGKDGALSDALGVTEFDPSGRFLATGGIARKIRLYNFNSLLPFKAGGGGGDSSSVAYLDHSLAGGNYYICTPAKLSSLKWKPGSDGRVIGSGDYDGVVMEYDLETKSPVFERDEHGGRRVWSVDYSRSGAQLMGASGSDDGSMQVWDPRCEGGDCVAALRPSAGSTSSVCCVEFDPQGGWGLAVGCADKLAYVYDTRMLANPVNVLDGHAKTVTYVRFLDDGRLVSSSVDGCLMLWDLGSGRPLRTYKGHLNCRNFVGLSVWRDGGLLGCGSETNQVFVYDKRWGDPIWVHGDDRSSCGGHDGFINSVCWRQQEGEEQDQCVLVAGGSDGALQVFQGKRK